MEQLVNNAVWAKMPLSREKLKEIPYGHRVRPYYIFEQKDKGEFYSFYTTSQNTDDRLIDADKLDYKHSTIILSEVHTLNYKDFLCEKNGELKSHFFLPDYAYDELVKKLSVNPGRISYPDKVKSKINKYMYSAKYGLKDILYNKKTNGLLISLPRKNGNVCYNISYIPTKGYKEFIIDGYKCYVDVSNPYMMDSVESCNLHRVSNNLPYIIMGATKAKECEEDLNITSLYDLPIGAFITLEKKYAMIKVRDEGDSVIFLGGPLKCGERNYKFYRYDKKCPINFSFYKVIDEKRLDQMLRLKLCK